MQSRWIFVETVSGPCATPVNLPRVHYTLFDRVFDALSDGLSFVKVSFMTNILQKFFDFRTPFGIFCAYPNSDSHHGPLGDRRALKLTNLESARKTGLDWVKTRSKRKVQKSTTIFGCLAPVESVVHPKSRLTEMFFE